MAYQKEIDPEEEHNDRGNRCMRICLILYILSGMLRGYGQCFDCLVISDYLIYGKDTISLQEHLFESYAQGQAYRLSHLGKQYTDNRERIYWKIVGEQVKLMAVHSGQASKKQIDEELVMLFGKNLDSGPFPVHLSDRDLHGKSGRVICRGLDMFYIFEKEWEVDFRNGRLTRIEQFDNSKSRTSVFFTNTSLLVDFVYSTINWSKLPPLAGREGRVFVTFSANDQGIVDRVEVLKSLDPVLDREAVRVVKLIPDWPVLYKRGTFSRFKYNLPITFTEEMRKKYQK
nr:energy transducer TonB [uncultured Dyadobacter sp.]